MGLLAVLAQTDANVVEVSHVRAGASLSVGQVEIAVQLETRGAEHGDEVLTRLRAEGYAPLLA